MIHVRFFFEDFRWLCWLQFYLKPCQMLFVLACCQKVFVVQVWFVLVFNSCCHIRRSRGHGSDCRWRRRTLAVRPRPHGFMMIREGFHKIRSSICDAIFIAQLLNGTLVIPEIQSPTSSKGCRLFTESDSRQHFYGFQGAPAGIFNSKYLILTHEFVYPYRNQFHQARETAKMLDLDGIVVIGGDDSNTNACLLAENFRSVIFCFLP
ncbi:putative diphosphate--fructose-6-phosphate 1-phosphotransferase [Helianthus anomalus]